MEFIICEGDNIFPDRKDYSCKFFLRYIDKILTVTLIEVNKNSSKVQYLNIVDDSQLEEFISSCIYQFEKMLCYSTEQLLTGCNIERGSICLTLDSNGVKILDLHNNRNVFFNYESKDVDDIVDLIGKLLDQFKALYNYIRKD